MTYARALRLAADALRAEAQRLAFEANLRDRFGLDDPGAVRASRRRAELQAAMALIEQQLSRARNKE